MKTKVEKSRLPLITLTFMLTVLAQAAPAATDVFADKMPKMPIYNGFNQTCPAGQVQTGYYNGQPQCVNYNMACPSGYAMTGIDANTGSPVCSPLPNVAQQPSCPAGQVMQGIDANGNAVCVVLPGGGGGGGGGGNVVVNPSAVVGNGCGECPYNFTTVGNGVYACNTRQQNGTYVQYTDANNAPICQVGNVSVDFNFMSY